MINRGMLLIRFPVWDESPSLYDASMTTSAVLITLDINIATPVCTLISRYSKRIHKLCSSKYTVSNNTIELAYFLLWQS